MDDRQPSLGLPSGITWNLANTTTPKLTNSHRGHAAAPARARGRIRAPTKTVKPAA
jgi:hypothetical protein